MRKDRTLVLHIWGAMMGRCYKPNNKQYSAYGGRGVTVCDEWHKFNNFLKWYNDNYVDGWEVDKDIKGGKEYSPDSCLFVPAEINMLLSNLRRTDNIAKGVYFEKESGKYKAQLSIVENGRKKRKNLGRFKDIESAYQRYLECKKDWMLVQAGYYTISFGMSGEVFRYVSMIAENLKQYLEQETV